MSNLKNVSRKMKGSSTLQKKSTLRSTFFKSIKIKKPPCVGKLRGRLLFRAAVRLVIEYKSWIGDDTLEFFGEEGHENVNFTKRKKSGEIEFLVKDRAILLIAPAKRTKEESGYIYSLFKRVRAFKDVPEDIRESLAGESIYQHVPAGRTIVRQGHKPLVQYYVIQGQLQMIKSITDDITGEVKEVDIGTLKAGDMFGEISLLHKVDRTATVVSKTDADLILITRSVFKAYLRNLLLDKWNELRDALVNFNYFKGWNEETMRECCILSRIVNFQPNEVLLGDGKGMVHYVYFILSGECQLIEHMLIEKKRVGKKMQYKLYDFEKGDEKDARQKIGRAEKPKIPDDNLSRIIHDNEPSGARHGSEKVTSPEDYVKLMASKKNKTNVTMDRISVITVTLQDVINEWHEITDVVEMLMVEPCIKSLGKANLKNVSTVFMQICIFNRGGCFGLGENMKNRRVVSMTPVKCLLVPRYWLLQHNRANIWIRVKNFLNSKYPDNIQIFQKYVENRQWAKHKREYVNKIVNASDKLRNDTLMYHVPYSIRINEDIVDE